MHALETMDSLMLAGERVGSAMHVGIVLLFTPPPGVYPGRFVDSLYEESLIGDHEVDPRLRRHPYRGADSRNVWVWRELPEIDLRKHVLRTTLPPGSDLDALWQLVSELHGERLDMDAPLWTSHLIDGLADGRFALYIKVHHTVIDGVGGLQMIGHSLSRDPEKRSMPPFYANHSHADRTAHEGTGHDPRSGHSGTRRPWLTRPFGAVRAIADAAAAGLDLTRRVATAELANILGSLVTDAVVPPFAAPHTRFNSKLGPRRTAIGTTLDRNRIRAVQEAADVTANDVIIALVAGVMRTWLLERDELPQQSLVAMCPVSVRHEADADHAAEPHDDSHSGNQFGLGLCPLGTDIADPAERLALIHGAMNNIKRQVAEKGPNAMLAVMGPAIGSTVVFPLLPFGALLPPSCNMAISSVPGPHEEMYFNGAHLDEIYPVSSIYDGMGFNVTVCTYVDRVGVGYVTEAILMRNIAELVPLTEQAFAELEVALGIRSAP